MTSVSFCGAAFLWMTSASFCGAGIVSVHFASYFKLIVVHRQAHRCDSSVGEHRVGDRKVADSRFDSRTGDVSLCPWERHVTLSIGAKQSTRCGVLA